MTRFLSGCVILTLATVSLAEPPDKLLEQAVKEREGMQAAGDAKAAADLISQADRLAEQQKFDDALKLYEKAYRLDPGNQDSYARMLIAKRMAGRLSEAETEALDLIEDGRALRVEDTFRTVRLDIIQAREALRRQDRPLAILKVNHARAALARLPRDVDSSLYRKELDRLIPAAAAKSSAARKPAVHLSEESQPPSVPVEPEAPKVHEPDYELQYLMKEEQQYTPHNDLERYFGLWDEGINRKYASDMDRAIRAARAEWYFDTLADGVTPRADMAYPADWPQRTARRARYAEGEIYRGPITKDKEGRDVYTSVYDLGDLVHPVPNFYGVNPDANIRLQGLLDRQALRNRSMIFGGWAEDLAAGLPLMPFFGGIDNWAVSPKSDPRELDRVLRTIDAFVGH